MHQRLILHFDLNKTLLMSDPASNVDVESMTNGILSECVYGHVDTATKKWNAERIWLPMAHSDEIRDVPGDTECSFANYLQWVALPDKIGICI